MIMSNRADFSIFYWLRAACLLFAAVVLPLGLAEAQDYDAVEKRLATAVVKGELSLGQASAMMDTLHEEAEAMLAEIDARVAGFEVKAEQLLAEYTAAGEAARDRIIADAKTEADRIRAEAKRVAENEAARARDALEAEIVDQAIDAAQSLISDGA